MRPIERVMLIYPPVTFSPQSLKQSHLPLGLAYLAGVLRGKVELNALDAAVMGHDHEESAGEKLLRYGLPFAEIERRIREFKPDLVGVSCLFSSQFRNVVEVMKAAKAVNPKIITITGGTHPTFLPELSMERCPDLDLIAQGEGEFTMLDLVRASRENISLADIPGLVWRRDGAVVINAPRPPHPNVDEIPFPARDLFPLERYHQIGLPMGIVYKRRPIMNLITSRGCPYHCTFCSSTKFWGACYRKRSAENVLAEMEHLYKDLGIREFKFFDDNLTSDMKRAKAIFQGMIERGINVTWNTPNGIHVVSLDDELLELMKKSGAYELTLAVESGDQDVLKNIIKKPTRLEQVQDAARRIRQKGIGSYGFFIIGFPGESKEQIRRTLDFSRRLDLDRISCFIFNPLPGTPLFEECVAKGYVKPGDMTEDVDYFEARFDTPEWTRDELQKLRRGWFWKYNLGQLLRHPLRFLSRYFVFMLRPGIVIEIIRRRLRS
jgi:magnesium-protoporphyrin IX monomethyl ester (oxidative) cyclase